MNTDAQATRASLLIRLRDARDAAAWEQFVEIYTPLIYQFCRQRGLQDTDAADVGQEVMRAVAGAMEKFEYDPQRGKFRNWLLTVVRSKFHNYLTKQQRGPELAGESTLQLRLDQDATPAEASAWDADYYRRIFHWATERVRGEFQESTWQAFWRTAIDGRDGKEVAQSLGLSVGAIYVAKSRVIARLKQEIQNVDADSMEPPDFSGRA